MRRKKEVILMNNTPNPTPVQAGGSEELALLRELAGNAKKQTRGVRVIMAFAIGLFAVIAAAAILLVPRALSTLRSVETMVENTNTLIEDNAEALTGTVSQFSRIDFEGLNDSIQDLQDIISPIARLFGGGH